MGSRSSLDVSKGDRPTDGCWLIRWGAMRCDVMRPVTLWQPGPVSEFGNDHMRDALSRRMQHAQPILSFLAIELALVDCSLSPTLLVWRSPTSYYRAPYSFAAVILALTSHHIALSQTGAIAIHSARIHTRPGSWLQAHYEKALVRNFTFAGLSGYICSTHRVGHFSCIPSTVVDVGEG